jgi:hypothetical protein
MGTPPPPSPRPPTSPHHLRPQRRQVDLVLRLGVELQDVDERGDGRAQPPAGQHGQARAARLGAHIPTPPPTMQALRQAQAGGCLRPPAQPAVASASRPRVQAGTRATRQLAALRGGRCTAAPRVQRCRPLLRRSPRHRGLQLVNDLSLGAQEANALVLQGARNYSCGGEAKVGVGGGWGRGACVHRTVQAASNVCAARPARPRRRPSPLSPAGSWWSWWPPAH